MIKRKLSLRAEYNEDVRRATHRLLEKTGQHSLPIDIYRVAEVQGVSEIREANLGSTDAQITRHGDGFLIEVNRFASPRRKRFSIAHEIAHTFFNPRLREYRRTGGAITIDKQRPEAVVEEALCDLAAAELLMPRELFVEASEGRSVGIESIEQIADLFDTSVEATALRYGKLAHTGSHVVVWTRRYGAMRTKWSCGQVVTDTSPFPIRRPGDVVQWHIAKAYFLDCSVRANEMDISAYPPRRVWLEAKGYRRGAGRFVLSLLRSAFVERR